MWGTLLTEETLTRQGVGASTVQPTESSGSRGATGLDDDGSEERNFSTLQIE